MHALIARLGFTASFMPELNDAAVMPPLAQGGPDHDGAPDAQAATAAATGGTEPAAAASPAGRDSVAASDDGARIARQAALLGFEIVDIGGFLKELGTRSADQLSSLSGTLDLTDEVLRANAAVTDGITTISTAVQQALDISQDAVFAVRASVGMSRDLATWVSSVGTRIDEISNALKWMETRTAMIEQIALQVYMLSVNAGIEATRAGDAGRGFAVIAKTVKELSDQTNATTEEIRRSVHALSHSVQSLSQEAAEASQNALAVTQDSLGIDQKLTQISHTIEGLSEITATIRSHSDVVQRANDNFDTTIRAFGNTVSATASDLHGAVTRVNRLIDASETLVQLTADQFDTTEDRLFIDRVRRDATQLGRLLEQALAQGILSEAQLFSRDYTPIAGTNPQQCDAPFCAATDSLFPALQEEALTLSDKVVFCAAVNIDGFLPTHNRKFSHPQTRDPVWNAAHCRNRRLFNDRVGLKAGQSKAPFLLQVYRRDMGNDQSVMMKDVSAPITVAGRHWGGLRLAYKV
jgi:methyl-accepting chemotaxis protein